jgi:predicted ATP-grasp superfamily ATP-dependent carboligase
VIQREGTPVILLGGEAIALSIARSLSPLGIPVFSLDLPTSYTRHSRFCTWIRLSYPQCDLEPVWLQWLLREGKRNYRGAILFPCCDDGLELIARNRQILSEDFILPEANDALTLAMLDKEQTAEVAASAGVPTARLWHAGSIDDINNIIPFLTFPCALKPRHSHLFKKYFYPLKLLVARNADELLDCYRKVEPYGLEMIISEIIPGSDSDYYSYYTYFDETGTPLFHFTKRKLRQYPPEFGQWTYHISGWYPDVAEAGLKFFRDAGLRGIGTIEFKRDARDGKLKLIECNPRFTLAIELLKFCGIEWALFVYCRLTKQTLPQVEISRKEVRVIRVFGDMLAFRQLRKSGLITWGKWLTSIAHRQHFQYFRWSDPMPTLVRITPILHRQLLKLFALIASVPDH